MTIEWSASYGNGFGDQVQLGNRCESFFNLAPIGNSSAKAIVPCAEFDDIMTNAVKQWEALKAQH